MRKQRKSRVTPVQGVTPHGMPFILSCIIPASLASGGDLKTIATKPDATAVVSRNGVATRVALNNEQQQQVYARQLVASKKRSVNKDITALFTATGAATALLGDAFAATGLADANGSWTFQNGASAVSAAANKAAFNNMVIGQPFKYVGLQIDVSAFSIWGAATWREYVTDYDSTNNYDYKPKINAAINTYAQISTTRFLRVGGEFNGNWALYITGLTNGQTVNFTFNCVDIQRSW